MKKNKLFFLIIPIATILLLDLAYCKQISSSQYSNKLISLNFLKKVSYYDPILDSFQRVKFKNNYQATINKIASIEGPIEVIGERTKISNDSIVIESFIVFKKDNNYFVSIISNINGVIYQTNYNRKIIFPEFSLFCNEHYFYLSELLYPLNKYNSYSLVIVNKQYLETKIFLSKKFDTFNNVICNCDNSQINIILEYINRQFNLIAAIH